MEYFDVVDENGKPTGEIVERKEAHCTPHISCVDYAQKRRQTADIIAEKMRG